MDKRLVKPIAVSGLLALLLIGWLMGRADGDGPKYHPKDPAGISKGEAWDQCKRAVEAKLRNPDSADFRLTSVTTAARANGYDIAGSLNAENDLGVEQTLAFSCDVTKQGATAQVVRP